MAVNDVIDAVDDVLRQIDAKFPSKTDQKNIQALVCVRTDIENALFQNVYGEVALSPVDAPSVCLGVDTLGNYFTALLYQSEMPTKWAKVVAAHLVKNCKLYASGYCGGETHLISVPNEGTPVSIDDQAEINKLEAHLAEFDEAMRLVLPDDRANEDTLEHRLEMLNDAIRKARKSFAIKLSGVAAVGLTGTVSAVVVGPKPTPED